MNKLTLLFLLSLLVALGLACSPLPASVPAPEIPAERRTPRTLPTWQERWEQAIKGAGSEGKVTVYSSIGNEARQEIAEGFQQKFGLTVEFVTGRGPEISQKVISERRAGIYLADAFIQGTQTIISFLKPNKVPAPIEPSLLLPEVTDPKVWIMGQIPFSEKDHMGIIMAASFDTYIAHNTDFVKKGEITSYHDLLNPGYKGKIALFDPLIAGSGQSAVGHLAYVLGVDQARTFLRDLVKQEPVISDNYRQMAEWLARGKYPLVVGTRSQETTYFKSLGSPIEMAKTKEGGKIGDMGGSLALADNPAHPNGAIVFANWLLSQEGQVRFQKGFSAPSSRMDVPQEHITLYRALPGDKFYIENEKTIELIISMVEFSKEVFGPLRK